MFSIFFSFSFKIAALGWLVFQRHFIVVQNNIDIIVNHLLFIFRDGQKIIENIDEFCKVCRFDQSLKV